MTLLCGWGVVHACVVFFYLKLNISMMMKQDPTMHSNLLLSIMLNMVTSTLYSAIKL